MKSPLLWIGILGWILYGVAFAFALFAPVFGDRDKSFSSVRIATSPQQINGKFYNTEPRRQGSGFNWGRLINRFSDDNNTKPKNPLPVIERSAGYFNQAKNKTRITWFGHSAMLLEIDGKKLFLDPMLGDFAGPLSWISLKRFTKKLPLHAEDLPPLDAVLISHDHYDHLDYPTIQKIKNKVGMFFVPVGVGSHLAKWGIEKAKITELDWWDETTYKGLEIVLTPANHFSGRTLGNRNSTLWGSWVIKGPYSKVYFSGDTGYGRHFKEIGEKYGPIDIAMMECGQYSNNWPSSHMTPEESIQAFLDLKGQIYVPIHWAAFKISSHPWDEPPQRALKEAQKRGVTVATPRIGESILLGAPLPTTKWWQELP